MLLLKLFILQICLLLVLTTLSIKNFCECQYLDPNVAATLPSLSSQDAYTLGYQQQPVLLPTTYASTYVTPQNSFYPVQYAPAAAASSPVATIPLRFSISPLPSSSSASSGQSQDDYSTVGIQIAGDLVTASSDGAPADAPPKETKALYKRRYPLRPVVRPGRALTRLISIVKY